MTPSELARKMADAGATTEAIILALEAVDACAAADAARRARARDKKRAQREKDKAGTVSGQSVDCLGTDDGQNRDIAGDNLSPKESPPTPPKEITPIPSSLRSDSHAREAEFAEQFWPAYPHKVGKPAALTAYVRARKQFELSEILEGLELYVVNKPRDRSWLNPSTFLNQHRFNDRPAATGPPANGHRRPLTFAEMARMPLYHSENPYESASNAPPKVISPDAANGSGGQSLHGGAGRHDGPILDLGSSRAE